MAEHFAGRVRALQGDAEGVGRKNLACGAGGLGPAAAGGVGGDAVARWRERLLMKQAQGDADDVGRVGLDDDGGLALLGGEAAGRLRGKRGAERAGEGHGQGKPERAWPTEETSVLGR